MLGLSTSGITVMSDKTPNVVRLTNDSSRPRGGSSSHRLPVQFKLKPDSKMGAKLIVVMAGSLKYAPNEKQFPPPPTTQSTSSRCSSTVCRIHINSLAGDPEVGLFLESGGVRVGGWGVGGGIQEGA